MVMDSGPSVNGEVNNGRNNALNQTTQGGFGVKLDRNFNKTDLSTKHSTVARIKNQSNSIQVGYQSLRNNSIAEAVEAQTKTNKIFVDDHSLLDDDRIVIAPNNSNTVNVVSARNSMAIRAKLRPLLNEERVEQTTVFMEEQKKMREAQAKRLNRRKSMSKRVNQSFSVDTAAVQRKIERGSCAENLPSNRFMKVSAKPNANINNAQKKNKKKARMEVPSDVVGWTQISEEQDFANSDFETMMFEH